MQDLTDVKGIGKKTAALLKKLGIETQEDLLRHYPRRYEKYETPVRAGEVCEGRAAVIGTVRGSFRHGGGDSISLMISDETGSIILRWFRNPYIEKILRYGETYVFYGNASEFAGRMSMAQPSFLPLADYRRLEGTIMPVYGLTKGISNSAMFRFVLTAISQMEEPEDKIPKKIREERGLISEGDAVRCIHYPADEEVLEAARHRLVFDEFFNLIYSVRYRSLARGRNEFSFPHMKVMHEVRDRLPFPLTGAQDRALADVIGDMKGLLVCNRLVQGDVGCGKTVVAALSMILCAENGYQAALMAPTEVLAAQHFREILSMLDGVPQKDEFEPVLLTGSMKEKEKKEVREKIASGKSRIIVGTHALIQKSVSYENLALAVIDEQHRFGVEQREAFAEKSRKPIHAVIMTATPIPRTTGNILFGGMDVSIIDEKPVGRRPIRSCAASPEMRAAAYALMKREIDAGRQAYVICPMVEENGDGGKKSAEGHAAEIRKAFPDMTVGVMHGRLDPGEKQKRMNAFACGETNVLVATTVVEVGVNVPNATVILIEDADMFGMLQLHQLRGRVGRGSETSYCVFMNSKDEPSEKLETLARTENGFEIAEADYRMRKAGSLLGTRQSGSMGFLIADMVRDEEILKEAEEAVDGLLPKSVVRQFSGA